MTKWVTAKVPSFLCRASTPVVNVISAEVTSGHASCVMVRGKVRPGYDLQFKIQVFSCSPSVLPSVLCVALVSQQKSAKMRSPFVETCPTMLQQVDVTVDQKESVTFTGEINDTDDADDFTSSLMVSKSDLGHLSLVKEIAPELFAGFQHLKVAMVDRLSSETEVCTFEY
eukprot:SAG31_NODE_2557_length_5492_cov_13.987762_3_plen_170_part_00